MNFRTKIEVPFYAHPIDYNSKIVSLGSCFAQNMGDKFEYFKLQCTTNPFGIIFNPISIEKLIKRAVEDDFYTEEDIFFYNERWQSFEVHSELSHSDKQEFLNILNRALSQTKTKLLDASHLILTYGTAWVYRHLDKGCIVANCHKLPQKQFIKELLSIEKMTQSLANTMANIQKINPKCRLIFTISPVRHLKDGFIENQRSKAHLIAAVQERLSHQQNQLGCYFPSYEIMMDELRDYRFYAEDMLHPNQLAIDYIWSSFKDSFIAPTACGTMDEVENIQKALRHRPFNPNSESHQKFQKQLNEKITKLALQYPFMKF